MTAANHRDRALQHLANYKERWLGVVEQGISTKTRQSYKHILPVDQRHLNILETIRDEFFAYQTAGRIKLHADFHHLNSSQALCFNLFFLFCFLPDADPVPLLRLLGVEATGLTQPRFEAPSQHREYTTFDFAADLVGGGCLLVEVKFTEREFGTAPNDAAHQQKREKMYLPLLEGKVRPEALVQDTFFAHHQILRLVAHVQPAAGHCLRLLVPRGNEGLRPGLRFIEEQVLPEVQRLVKVVYMEGVLDRLYEQKSSFPPVLAEHVELLVQKYDVPENMAEAPVM